MPASLRILALLALWALTVSATPVGTELATRGTDIDQVMLSNNLWRLTGPGPSGTTLWYNMDDPDPPCKDQPCYDGCNDDPEENAPFTRQMGSIRILHAIEADSPFLPDEAVRILWNGPLVNPHIQFDCTGTSPLPEVCQNMCFGIYCSNHPSTLTKRSADKGRCRAARSQNSCGGNPNRCSVRFNPPYGQGFSCDEYPFASTLEGQRAGTLGYHSAVTRCVPRRQNSVQGGKISAVYRNMNDNDQFDVEFQFDHPGGPGYCATGPDCTVVAPQQMN